MIGKTHSICNDTRIMTYRQIQKMCFSVTVTFNPNQIRNAPLPGTSEHYLRNSLRGPPSSCASSPEKSTITGLKKQKRGSLIAVIADRITLFRLTITVTGSPEISSVNGLSTSANEFCPLRKTHK